MRCVIIMYVIYTYSLWVYDVYIQAEIELINTLQM